MIIEDTITRLLKLGMDLGTKDAVKSALQLIDADTSVVDSIYVELKNRFNRKSFARVPYNKRALFLSHCLRHSEKCPAKLSDDGLMCEECGNCSICEIKQEAEKLGYTVYIVPGGSMVFKIIKRAAPDAVMGVACYFELEEAFEKLTTFSNLPYQGVQLSKDGCKDTEVDVDRVLEVLRRHEGS